MKKIIFIVIAVFNVAANSFATDEWQVNRIVHDEKNIYVATEEKGLIVIDKSTGVQTQYIHEMEIYWKQMTDLSLHKGKLYSINKHGFLGIFDGDGMRYEYIDGGGHPSLNYPRLAWSPNGMLWTNNMSSLVIYAGKVTFTGKFDEMYAFGISEEIITSMAIDKDGIVWFGCQANGGDKCFNRFTMENGLSYLAREAFLAGEINHAEAYGKYVWAIEIDDNENKWFSSEKGLVLYDKSEKLTLFELEGTKNDLSLLPDGRLLVPNEKNLYLFYSGNFHLLCENAVSRTILSVDADDDTYYFGTSDGLFKYKNGSVTHIPLLGQTSEINEPVLVKNENLVPKIYDLHGRQMIKNEKEMINDKESLPTGIYVTKGRKFVIK